MSSAVWRCRGISAESLRSPSGTERSTSETQAKDGRAARGETSNAVRAPRNGCAYADHRSEGNGMRFLWCSVGNGLSMGTCSNAFLPFPAQPRGSRGASLSGNWVGSGAGYGDVAVCPQSRGGEPAAAAQKTLVGSNIYGWGQYAQRDKKQLDVEEVISALRDTGYDYLETNHERGPARGECEVRRAAQGQGPPARQPLHRRARARGGTRLERW